MLNVETWHIGALVLLAWIGLLFWMAGRRTKQRRETIRELERSRVLHRRTTPRYDYPPQTHDDTDHA